ncbi:MAG: chromate efflux transporter [Pseudomonadota bacterium]
MKSQISQSEATLAFAKIGLLSFGGPAAQIAVMHRVLVEDKKWLTEQQFLHALNFCMLLPGPEAMQLATYAGWLMHGIRGGLIAGLLFILPGLAMMLSVSAIYVAFGEVPLVAGLLFGLKAAVLAVVLQALIKVSQRALGSPIMYVVAVAAFVAIFFVQLAFPLIIFGAAAIGYLMLIFVPAWLPASVTAENALEIGGLRGSSKDAVLQTARAIILWGGLWLGALCAAIIFAPGDFVSDAALFFSKTAAVTFGGAYAVLAFVGQQAVEFYGWLSADDMLKGLGLAETTLGPLVLVLVFVGYVGGATSIGGGLMGGLIAAFFTFVPCFLWIFAGAPHMERLRHLKWLSASLAAVTAAIVGVIANLAVWFGLNVIFGELGNAQFGIFNIPTIDITQFDWTAAIIALGSGIALLRLRLNLLLVLALAAIVGVVVSFL